MLFLLFSDCPIFPSSCCDLISIIEIISSGIENNYQFVFIPSIIILDNNNTGEQLGSPAITAKDSVENPPVNDFSPSSKGSTGYITIKKILTDNTMKLNEKQLNLENNLYSLWPRARSARAQDPRRQSRRGNWVKNLENLSKSKDFINTNPGFRLFINNYKLLENDLRMYFENKKYISNKPYISIFVKIDKSLMLFLTLTLLIPFIMIYEDNKEQSVTHLFQRLLRDF
jgi:hypothetical protein